MSRCRPATPADAVAIAAIYNEGIEDRIATFETRHRSTHDILSWFGGHHPIVVVEDGGQVVAFAAANRAPWLASLSILGVRMSGVP